MSILKEGLLVLLVFHSGYQTLKENKSIKESTSLTIICLAKTFTTFHFCSQFSMCCYCDGINFKEPQIGGVGDLTKQPKDQRNGSSITQHIPSLEFSMGKSVNPTQNSHWWASAFLSQCLQGTAQLQNYNKIIRRYIYYLENMKTLAKRQWFLKLSKCSVSCLNHSQVNFTFIISDGRET